MTLFNVISGRLHSIGNLLCRSQSGGLNRISHSGFGHGDDSDINSERHEPHRRDQKWHRHNHERTAAILIARQIHFLCFTHWYLFHVSPSCSPED
ncbi:hypothetical protein [uncultured Gimesia sp.]|uniref:hypothetical protein n=1 Tax=uncultured Gimesia sp. TaxID=1678688 RepID=UPI0030DD58BA